MDAAGWLLIACGSVLGLVGFIMLVSGEILGVTCFLLTGALFSLQFVVRDDQKSAHRAAVADLHRGGWVFVDASVVTNTVQIVAAGCVATFGMHRIRGRWEPTVDRRYRLPDRTVTAHVIVDRSKIAALCGATSGQAR